MKSIVTLFALLLSLSTYSQTLIKDINPGTGGAQINDIIVGGTNLFFYG